MEDSSGKEWSLRSIEKFPEAAIPPDLRSPFAVDLVEDGISASYPYASLSTGIMADAAKVPNLRRKLVYIPDDPRLGRFRSTFKNTLAVMEEKEPIKVAGGPVKGFNVSGLGSETLQFRYKIWLPRKPRNNSLVCIKSLVLVLWDGMVDLTFTRIPGGPLPLPFMPVQVHIEIVQ